MVVLNSLVHLIINFSSLVSSFLLCRPVIKEFIKPHSIEFLSESCSGKCSRSCNLLRISARRLLSIKLLEPSLGLLFSALEKGLNLLISLNFVQIQISSSILLEHTILEESD